MLLWNDKLGQMKKTEEYKETPLINKSCLKECELDGIPSLYSQNTGWNPFKMQNIIEFCKIIDKKSIDHFKALLLKGGCRPYLNDVS